MKKILMTVAIVCAAIATNAATANWTCVAANIYNGKGEAAAKISGEAYIFSATELITQQAIFDVFASGNDISAKSIATATVSAGGITAANSAFSYGEQGGGNYSYFFAIVDGDNIYLSKTVTAAANASDTAKSLGFGSQAPTTGASSKNLPTEGYVGVGQWATAAVPEPTSGLLMLLGMGALALRRRRA